MHTPGSVATPPAPYGRLVSRLRCSPGAADLAPSGRLHLSSIEFTPPSLVLRTGAAPERQHSERCKPPHPCVKRAPASPPPLRCRLPASASLQARVSVCAS